MTTKRPPSLLPPSLLLLPLLLLLPNLVPLVQADVSCFKLLTREQFTYCQNLAPNYALHWRVDADVVTFGIVVDGQPWNWVGLGLSEGGMSGADIWVVSNDYGNTVGGSSWTVDDYWSVETAEPISDGPDGQDVTLLSVSQDAYVTVVTLSRKMDTCNTTNDIAIYNDTDSLIIFAYGMEWGYHGRNNRGSTRVRLVPPPSFDASNTTDSTASYLLAEYKNDPKDLRTLKLSFPPYPVPAARTTYVCMNFEVPSDQKYHIIRFGGLPTTPMLHHAVLNACSQKPTASSPYTCDSTPRECSRIIAVWAMGFGNASLPVEAGIPFGKGSYLYFTLQLHYYNPQQLQGLVDTSGMVLYYTAQLRPNDLAILTLGSEAINVPPGQSDFALAANLCPSACTQKMNTTLNLVNNVFHMHQTGHTMITRHIRNGTELQPLGWRNNYNMAWQYASTVLPESRTLLPGDQLITTCSYNTTGRTTNTTLGLASYNEMCYNFLMYWPAVPDVEECITRESLTFSSCTTGAALDALFTSPNDTYFMELALQMAEVGQIFAVEPLPEYLPYVSSCQSATQTGSALPPQVYHTGAAIGAIVAITVILSFFALYLYQTYGKYEDPERLRLLAEVEELVMTQTNEAGGGLSMVSSGEWGEMKGSEASQPTQGTNPSLMFPKFTTVNTET